MLLITNHVVTAANSPVFSLKTSHQIHISRRRRKNERWAAQKPPSQSRGRRTGSGPGKIQRSARRSRQGIYYCTRRAFFCGVFRRRRRRASSSLGRAVTFSTDEERNLTQGTDSRPRRNGAGPFVVYVAEEFRGARGSPSGGCTRKPPQASLHCVGYCIPVFKGGGLTRIRVGHFTSRLS